MKKKCYYKYNLPFSLSLTKNLNDLGDRVFKDNKASLIIVDGLIGSGKTTMAVHLADYFNGAFEQVSEGEFKIIEEKFISLQDQLGLGGQDFAKKLKLCHVQKLPVIIYDEAGDFNSRGALTRFNATLNRVFEVFRAFKVIVILCLPLVASIDNSLFNKGIARMLIHCENRNNLYGSYKVYALRDIFYLLDKMKRYVVKTDAYRSVYPCMRGHFLDLPAERSNELDVISIGNKLEVLDEAEIKMEGLYSYQDISKRLGMSVSWLRERVSEFHIPAKKIFKKRKYFDDQAVDVLVNLLEEQRKYVVEK